MKKTAIILVGIIMLGFALRVYGITYGLPDINRYIFETDEQQLVNVALSFGMGDLNPHTFQQPGFFQYLLFFFFALAYAIGSLFGAFSNALDFAALSFKDHTLFYCIGRGINVVFGSATIIITYFLGKKVFNKTIGLVAALFLAVLPIHVFFSHVIKTDAAATFFFLCSLYYSFDILNTGKRSAYIKAGLCAGLALGCRYPAGIILISIFTAHFLHRKGGHKSVSSLLISCIVAGITFFLVSPYNILDWGEFTRQSKFLAITSSLDHTKYDWLLQHIINFTHPNELGPILTVLALAGIGLSFMKIKKSDIVLLSAWLPTYLFFSAPKWLIAPPQYLLPMFPIWMLLGAYATVTLMPKVLHKTNILIIGVGLLALQPFLTAFFNDHALSQKTAIQQAREWIETTIPETTVLLSNFAEAPQLTLTPAAYERWRTLVDQSNQRLWFGGVRRDFMPMNAPHDKSKLLDLRQTSITAGKQYELFFFNEYLKEEEGKQRLFSYIKEYTPHYVIATFEMEDRLAENPLPGLTVIKRFHAPYWIPIYRYNVGIYKVDS